MATHFLGKKIGYVLTRFIKPLNDEQFNEVSERGLPDGWVAWHLEDGEDVDNSERVKALSERPIAVVLSNGALGNLKTPKGVDICEIPYPVADPIEWFNHDWVLSKEGGDA